MKKHAFTLIELLFTITILMLILLFVFSIKTLSKPPADAQAATMPTMPMASSSRNVLPWMEGVQLNEVSYKGHAYLVGHKLYGLSIIHAASCPCLSNHPLATVLEQPATVP